MPKRRLTPEEQLLDIIEKEDYAGASKFKRRRRLRLSFASLKDSWCALGTGLGNTFARLKKGIKEPNLRVLNRILLVASFLVLGYSILDFAFGLPDIQNTYKRFKPLKEKKRVGKVPWRERPFLHYLEMVRRRNIFSPVKLEEPEKPEVKKKQLEELAKDLSLVGIYLDEEEPIAMIEDKQVQKTYFLKEGDSINKFTIQDILKSRVILSYEGETIELL
jgi:hypothetical protein